MTSTQTHTCQLCGAEKPANELYHDGKSFITCKDAEECLRRVGNKELALITAKELTETTAKQWARMKRESKRS